MVLRPLACLANQSRVTETCCRPATGPPCNCNMHVHRYIARWVQQGQQCRIVRTTIFSSRETIIYYIQSSTINFDNVLLYIHIITASGLTLISTTCSRSSVFLFALSNPMNRCKLGMRYQLLQTLCDSGGKHLIFFVRRKQLLLNQQQCYVKKELEGPSTLRFPQYSIFFSRLCTCVYGSLCEIGNWLQN